MNYCQRKIKKKSKMKKLNGFLGLVFVAATFVLCLNSCEGTFACHEDNISSAGSNKSHNKGQNCMVCHQAKGEGQGSFIAAGTVYDMNMTNTVSSGKVDFYTGPNETGTLKQTVLIDSKGNFYTTAQFNPEGLYPVVTGPTGNKKMMGSALSTGACNSCHGSSTDKLWVD
jgi:mono/diheme cytochrome c family protein